jgi:hypothetical protein
LYHKEHLLRAGMPVEELRSRLRVEPRQLASLINAWPEVRSTATIAAQASFAPALSTMQQAGANAYLSAPGGAGAATTWQAGAARLPVDSGVSSIGGGIVFDAQN